MKFYVMRGVPGSGKSTWIEKNLPEAEIASADKYCLVSPNEVRQLGDIEVEVDGIKWLYRFDVSKMAENHACCMRDFISYVSGRCPQVVLDNTCISRWEYMNYVEIAKKFGYQVEIHEFMPDTVNEIKLCVARNRHRVPWNVICNMVMNFQSDPDAISHKII